MKEPPPIPLDPQLFHDKDSNNDGQASHEQLSVFSDPRSTPFSYARKVTWSSPPSAQAPTGFQDFLLDHDAVTNDLSGYSFMEIETSGHPNGSHDQQHAPSPPTLATQPEPYPITRHDSSNRYGGPNAEGQSLESQKDVAEPFTRSPSASNTLSPPSTSVTRHFAPMKPRLPANIPTEHVPRVGVQSRFYTPFSGTLRDKESASDFRQVATRFNRKPYKDPETDLTINELKDNRLNHVQRIYNAMIRPDVAQDNPNSIAMRRWVHAAYYPSEAVESYAHKVFDCLLEQVEEGFRGWPHNDYASDERKGEVEDQTVTCAQRLETIIYSLEQEKTICEDVMNSACQIRMFVNAPRAYAARKSANRAGNSKRKKATDFALRAEHNSKQMKARRSSTRTRQTMSPEDNTLMTTIEGSRSLPLPTVALAPRPSRIYTLSGPIEMMSNAEVSTSVDALSDPPMALMTPPQPNLQRFSSMSLHRQSPFMSPPFHPHSVPVSPEEQPRLAHADANSSLSPNNSLGSGSHYAFQAATSFEPHALGMVDPAPHQQDTEFFFPIEDVTSESLYWQSSVPQYMTSSNAMLPGYQESEQGVPPLPPHPTSEDEKF